MTPDTVFWIASMTKAITLDGRDCSWSSAASFHSTVRIAESTGRARVPAGCSKASMPRASRGCAPLSGRSRCATDHPYRRVHLRNREPGNGPAIWTSAGGPGIITCRNAALNLPLAFDPGDRWDYGIGIDWAGQAVERSSGQGLGDYFAENLFGPIGNEGYRVQADPGPPRPAWPACMRAAMTAR